MFYLMFSPTFPSFFLKWKHLFLAAWADASSVSIFLNINAPFSPLQMVLKVSKFRSGLHRAKLTIDILLFYQWTVLYLTKLRAKCLLSTGNELIWSYDNTLLSYWIYLCPVGETSHSGQPSVLMHKYYSPNFFARGILDISILYVDKMLLKASQEITEGIWLLFSPSLAADFLDTTASLFFHLYHMFTLKRRNAESKWEVAWAVWTTAVFY